jgi:hypothetical protein
MTTDDPASAGQSAPLLIDIDELSRLTSLSIRTLRRMDISREIPGRVAVRRCVRFQSEVVRAWVRAGLPGPEHWAALVKRHGPR